MSHHQHLPNGARCEMEFRADGVICLTLSGELDLDVSTMIKPVLERAQSQSPVVAIDLSRVDFMDTTGVHMLVDAHARARRDGARFVVCRPAQPVRRVLVLTETHDLLTIQDGPTEDVTGGPR